MKIQLAAVILLLIFAVSCEEENNFRNVKLQWTQKWGTDLNDSGYSVTTDSDGNIYVTGGTSGSFDGNVNAGEYDAFISKINSNGVEEWTKQWGAAAGEIGTMAITDNSGNIYVTGRSSENFFLARFKNDGTKVWHKEWGTDERERFCNISMSKKGTVYLSGIIEHGGESEQQELFLTEWSASGKIVFEKKWEAGRDDNFKSVTVTSSGKILAVGYKKSDKCEDNDDLIYFSKWDSSGKKTMESDIGICNTGSEAISIAVDEEESVYIVGSLFNSFDISTFGEKNDIVLAKFKSDGTNEWVNETAGYYYNYRSFSPLIVKNDGVYFLYGSGIEGSDRDLVLDKWNTDGKKIWSQEWGTENEDEPRSVTIDDSGNVFAVSSFFNEENKEEIFLTKFEPVK